MKSPTGNSKRLKEIDEELRFRIIPYLTAKQIRWDPLPEIHIMVRMKKLNPRWYDTVERYHALMKEEKEIKGEI